MILDNIDLAAFDGEPIDEQGSRAITCCADTFTASHLDDVLCLTCTDCSEDIALIVVPERESTFVYNGSA